ncbi:DoxX family protein [Nocardiopsis sp. B62]|uniref:DoxX family protein n=1 Tax=Nocardiopsis sp. B62 TaxID=2824874 RepID=UPI001B3634B8|nr:DoxX family protein [Nocardiopsis sp. B62]MBQ1082372.1 DoxX family protein [Nocardiopsis sp. B62]
MTKTDPPRSGSSAPRGLNTTLWVAQWALALVFVGGGVWKLATPLAQVAEVFPWVGETPLPLFLVTSVLDVLGGLGVLLPALTRVLPGVTVLAAAGCAGLQVSAIAFHLLRGETDVLFNVVVLVLAVLVAWGRWTRVPLKPRA